MAREEGLSAGFDPDAMGAWLSLLCNNKAESSDVIAQVNEDDCAVLSMGGELCVLTCDFLNARPIATELGIASYADLGALVVGANLSDLLGSGARPKGVMMMCMMPRAATQQDFEQLMTGASHYSQKYGVPIVGGDTKLGPSFSVGAVAVGTASDRAELFLRRQAKVGDAVWLSGAVGSCSAATYGLSRGLMDDEWRSWAREAVLKPSLPFEQSRRLSALRLSLAGADVSDGLAASLAAICNASGVGMQIDVGQLPLDLRVRQLATKVDLPPWAFAFAIGGDFQYVVTGPATESTKLHELGLVRIGDVIPVGKQQLCLEDGRTVPLPTAGHRDAKGLQFAEEVEALVQAAAALKRSTV